MKKTLATIAGTLLAIVVIVGGVSLAQKESARSNSIGKYNALRFALEDEGFTEDQVQFIKNKFDRENGQYVYEVEFIKDGIEYDYDILATDGSVVSKDLDDLDRRSAGNNNASTNTTTSTQGITLEEAKAIALKDAGVIESQVSFSKAKLDEDDGVLHYELEFNLKGSDQSDDDRTEYEYDIKKEDGSILSKEIDRTRRQTSAESVNETVKEQPVETKGERDDDRDDDTTKVVSTPKETKAETRAETRAETKAESKPAPTYIGLERAKSIALNHVGLSSANFSKAKLDTDDGVVSYELEFYSGSTEYEYDIKATNGAILDYEWDTDDDYHDDYDDHDDWDDDDDEWDD